MKLKSLAVNVSESKPPLTIRVVPKEALLSDASNSQLISSLKPVRRVQVEATRSELSMMKLPGIPIFR